MSEVKEPTKYCSHCHRFVPVSQLKRIRNRYKCVRCVEVVAARDRELAEERKKLKE